MWGLAFVQALGLVGLFFVVLLVIGSLALRRLKAEEDRASRGADAPANKK